MINKECLGCSHKVCSSCEIATKKLKSKIPFAEKHFGKGNYAIFRGGNNLYLDKIPEEGHRVTIYVVSRGNLELYNRGMRSGLETISPFLPGR